MQLVLSGPGLGLGLVFIADSFGVDRHKRFTAAQYHTSAPKLAQNMAFKITPGGEC